MVAGTVAADGAARVIGKKDGIIKPMVAKVADVGVDLRDSFTGQETPKESKNSDSSKSSDSTKSKVDDSVHNKSSHYSNVGGHPTNANSISNREKVVKNLKTMGKYGVSLKSQTD